MNERWSLLSYVLAALTVVLTLLMLVTFRSEKRISFLSSFLSAVLSMVLLPVFLAVTGARLNPILGVPVLVLGLLVGFAKGQTMRLYYKGNGVMGRHSLLFLLFWGTSLVAVQLLTTLESRLWSSVGLLPVFFTTGTQVGMYTNLALRRLLIRPPKMPAT